MYITDLQRGVANKSYVEYPFVSHRPIGTWPKYLALSLAELSARAVRAAGALKHCVTCAVACGADRTSGCAPQCRTGRYARVASYFAHRGEESPISGWAGSGTIFFAGCNLHCVFCQNHDISQGDEGIQVSDEALASIMLDLQRTGCHNVNLVSPSHVVPQFLAALALAVPQGLRLPIVYNSGGYDSLPTLRLLDGIVDIYMPDAKYADDDVAHRLSGIRFYARVNRLCLKEMHRQVGNLVVDDRGIALRGLLVRHLVLPNDRAGMQEVARFIAQELSCETYVNIMSQYRPAYLAIGHWAIGRTISGSEYRDALEIARSAGLRRLAES